MMHLREGMVYYFSSKVTFISLKTLHKLSIPLEFFTGIPNNHFIVDKMQKETSNFITIIKEVGLHETSELFVLLTSN